MTTSSTHGRTTAARTAHRIGRLLSHCTLAAVVVSGAMALGQASGTGLGGYASSLASALAPAPVEAGRAQGLFDPAAVLDTRTIDDLRTDPESQCLATDGVVTPSGACVDAIAVWESELAPGIWEDLLAAGYVRDIEFSEEDDQAMFVPAEMVILGGEGGKDVVSVAMNRQLTPRA